MPRFQCQSLGVYGATANEWVLLSMCKVFPSPYWLGFMSRMKIASTYEQKFLPMLLIQLYQERRVLWVKSVQVLLLHWQVSYAGSPSGWALVQIIWVATQNLCSPLLALRVISQHMPLGSAVICKIYGRWTLSLHPQLVSLRLTELLQSQSVL